VHTEYEDTQVYKSKACYGVSDHKPKTKRSVSKQHLKLKKPLKVLNDSLFESSKHLPQPKEPKPRSISTAKKEILKGDKPRSSSKGGQDVKPLKLPPKLRDKAVDREEVPSRRIADEYQLGKTKCPSGKQRKRSNSSDVSYSSREASRGGSRAMPKGRGEGGSRQKGLREKKEGKTAYWKHYYV
jgi:hypothetical protein